MFQPDIFSKSRPVFSAAPAAAESAVRRVAAAAFPHALQEISQVEQFGGIEINSNNFKVVCASGTYLLKRLSARPDSRALRAQIGLNAWLHDSQGVQTPAVIRDSAGDLLAADDTHLWCLFEFRRGDFFAGGLAQLRAVGDGIGRLQRALAGAPAEWTPPRRWEYLTADDAGVFAMTGERASEWPRVFGGTTAAVLAGAWQSVQRVGTELQAARERIRGAPLVASHCDLHPHNLLFEGDRLTAFIDFESFTSMPAAAAIGFATYKLLRQHAAAARLASADAQQLRAATATFLAAMQATGERLAAQPESLRLFGLAEIFRRVLVVFRLNLREGSQVWNHVLPMHLAALEEFELIFGDAALAH